MTKTSNKKLNLRFSVISVLVVIAALSRLIPHPPNMAPIAGMALFGAAYYNKKYWAFIIPIVAMWVSDLVLNNVIYAHHFDNFVWFYSGSLFTYGAFALIVLMGTVTMKKINAPSVLFSALGASVIFFIISNFGVWLTSPIYAKSWVGLVACYTAAIPFMQNTLLGDLGYTVVLVGLFELSKVLFPELRISSKGLKPLTERVKR